MPRHHLLIGSGPGAISAAEAIRGTDPAARITVVSDDPHGYYSRPGLAYYLANEVPEKGLFPFTSADFARLNVESISGRAARIDRHSHRVVLTDGRELAYDRLLISTGSTAIPGQLPGIELDGVVKLDDMDDARSIIQRSRKARTAVVVGGGITALEIAEGLKAHGVHVHYLMRKDRYWGNVLSDSESRMVERGLAEQGVQIHYFAELSRILGKDGRVSAAETNDGARIPCEIVAVAIGVRPRTELAEAAGLTCGRGILVDEYLRTNDFDIFAAGDVAEVCDATTDRRTLEVLWSSAVGKGRVAGLNMATEPVHIYDEPPPLNITRLAGYKTTIIGTVGSGKDADLQGLSRGDSQIWGELAEARMVESDGEDTHIRLALGASTIAGAIVMGDQAVSYPLQDLVEARVDISGMAAALQAPGARIAETVTEFWHEWKAARV